MCLEFTPNPRSLMVLVNLELTMLHVTKKQVQRVISSLADSESKLLISHDVVGLGEDVKNVLF